MRPSPIFNGILDFYFVQLISFSLATQLEAPVYTLLIMVFNSLN